MGWLVIDPFFKIIINKNNVLIISSPRQMPGMPDFQSSSGTEMIYSDFNQDSDSRDDKDMAGSVANKRGAR